MSDEYPAARSAAEAYTLRLDDLLTHESDEQNAHDIDARLAAGEDVKLRLIWHGGRLAVEEVPAS